jgi:hypothetical protein
MLEASQYPTSNYTAETEQQNSIVFVQKQEDQWIRIEDPDINPCTCSQLIFNKGAQNAQ